MGGDKSRDGKSAGKNRGDEMKRGMITILRFYKKYLSRGEHCRFVPSCSVYTAQAVEKYGVIKGVAKGMWRLARCNRWSKGGVDKV